MGKRRPRLLGLIAAALLWVAPAFGEVLQVNDLAGGLNDSVPGNMVADNEAVSISNFQIDPMSRGLIQRRGSRKQNTSQLSGSSAVDVFNHVKTNGNAYLIATSSRTVYYSTDNGANFTALITTATAGTVWDGTSFLDDNFYMVNQNDGGWYFTGTAFTFSPAIPAGKYIEVYQNRLFVANTSGNPYRLFFSGLLQPSTFTVSTDYIDFPEAITAIGKPFDGGLPVYTKNTTWMLRGSGPNDFYLQQISGVIGCSDNRTIQNVTLNGTEVQVFFSLGPNGSRKNLYALLGNRLIDLGDRIVNTLANVSVFDTSSRQFDWDLDTDFGAGTLTNVYASGSAEAVKLSTGSRTDTLSADFSAGTFSNTSVMNDRVYLSSNNVDLVNPSFEVGVGTTATSWTTISGSAQRVSSGCGTPPDGSFYLKMSSDSFSVADTVGATGLLFNSSAGTCPSFKKVYAIRGANGAAFYPSGKFTGFALESSYSGGTVNQIQQTVLSPDDSSGTLFSFYLASDGSYFYIDKIEGGRSSITSGTFTSATYDTTFSSAAFMPSGATWTANGHSISATTQESSDGSSWDSAVAWSTGSVPSSANRKRYKRYVLTLSTGNATTGTALPYVDDVTLAISAATGTVTSEIRDGSTDISSWDIFNTQTSGVGAHSYSYRTNASSTSITSAPWNSVSSGGDVSGSARYYQWKDDISLGTSTVGDPTLERVTQNYTATAGSAQPATSAYWNEEYWMAYSSTSSAKNDSVLVMNKEGKFSTFSGLNLYGLTIHNRQILGGDSITDGLTGGYVRQYDTGTTDDGAAVTASVVLKHQEFPELSDWTKIVSPVFFNYGVDVGQFTFSTLENFSEVQTDYTVQFASGTNINRWQQQLNPGTTAKQLGLKFSNSYSGSRLKLYPPISIHYQRASLIAP